MQIRPFSAIRAGVVAVALSAAATAFAQSDKDKDKAKDAQGNKQQIGELQKFTEIKGFDVQTEDGQRCGKIENVALDLENARPVYFLINTAGVQDLGDKLIPVPGAALDFSKVNQRQVRVNVNMNRFKDAPDFSPQGWQTMGDPKWGRIVHQHYAVEWIEPGKSTSGQQAQPHMLVQAGELPNLRCFAKQREEIGRCQDALLDIRRATAPLMLIDPDGQGNQNKELTAIPTPLCRYNAAEKALIVQIDKDQLRDAPRFTENSQFKDEQRIQRVFAHFNVDPDTIYGYASPSRDDDNKDNNAGGGRGADEGRLETWHNNSQYGHLFDPNRMVTIDGRVTAVDRKRPMDDMAPGVILTVRDNEGRTHEVHLGPAWFVERQQNMLRDGDQVVIRGSQASHNGQTFVMAAQVRREGNVMLLRNRDGIPAWDAWHDMSELRSSARSRNANDNNRRDDKDRDNDDDDKDDDWYRDGSISD